jgi:hypothetical protein
MMLNFGANNWVWQRWNCMKLRVWEAIRVQSKAIEKIRTKMKSIKSQIKNPNFYGLT